MRIEIYTFYGCTSLTSVTIGNRVMRIANYAFGECDFLEVISKIENPFNINPGPETFTDKTYTNATLYVPVGTIEKYKTSGGWNKFVNIKEGSPSSMTNIESEETKEYKRYTLDGKILKNPHKGINIIDMNNGSTKKVVVK
jgi:hypothetical protein